MSKKYLLLIILLVVGGGLLLNYSPNKDSGNNTNGQCKVNEMVFYYLEQCSWCQKVKKERTISKIEDLGVNVKQINANTGSVLHQIQGVPTFIINEKIYSGYKTFEELKELLGCEEGETQSSKTEFDGEKGEGIALVNGQLSLDSRVFSDGLARYYNTELPNGKIIYFFVVKDKDGDYRAAANACQVCFDTRMGFRQQGDYMVCNTCGNKYPLEKIATEKGGCNPGPINPNLEVKDDKIIIKQSELEQVAEFF